MILAAHQLHYLPWLRYVHKMASCDIFVVLDNIQFNKNGWQNRNKIKTPQGTATLTVPVYHRFAQSLIDVQIDKKSAWRRKHRGSLEQSYQKAPYFRDHEAFFEAVYGREWEKLNDLNYDILFYLIKVLGIKTQIVKSSDLHLRGEASERLAGICKDLGARAYLTGSYAADAYLDKSPFEKEGINILFHQFECPRYPQRFPENGFVPELSIVDMLFNCGPRSLETLLHKNAAAPAA